jgi:hypothetical protein
MWIVVAEDRPDSDILWEDVDARLSVVATLLNAEDSPCGYAFAMRYLADSTSQTARVQR